MITPHHDQPAVPKRRGWNHFVHGFPETHHKLVHFCSPECRRVIESPTKTVRGCGISYNLRYIAEIVEIEWVVCAFGLAGATVTQP